ncbi:MAG: hypothetical protein M3440_09535 [Chloroflexota bacterium]|nr:hypothetical protein [Chloroflexota bacterium]
MVVKVRIVRNDLPAIAARLPIARRTIVARRGAEMVQIAQSRSRVDTDEMRKGWAFRETSNGGVLENNVPHTVHNEYGTYKMSAQPMARPAAEQVFPKIIQDFADIGSLLK